MSPIICQWCGQKKARFQIVQYDLCDRCTIIAGHSLILGQEVAELIQKGGVQLYIGIQRAGSETQLIAVKRWSPLENSLESING
jgi:hypothetical protein